MSGNLGFEFRPSTLRNFKYFTLRLERLSLRDSIANLLDDYRLRNEVETNRLLTGSFGFAALSIDRCGSFNLSLSPKYSRETNDVSFSRNYFRCGFRTSADGTFLDQAMFDLSFVEKTFCLIF